MICIGRNSTYRLRYWNQPNTVAILHLQLESRNSTYRLRYWNEAKGLTGYINELIESQQYLPFTVLKHIQTAIFSNE